jgi:antirestriction protein ArdC
MRGPEPTNTMSNGVYEIVTERIVSLLEGGTCPWRRPWSTMPLSPRNHASGRPYSGINMLLLSCVGHEVPLYLTFRQVAERGGSVKKGSKGLPVIYWKAPYRDEETEDGEDRRAGTRVPILRYYTVFNACQIEGVDFPTVPTRAEAPFSPVGAAEAVVAGWSDGPRVEHGFAQASYLPGADRVEMPSPGSFDSPGDYHATLFHELAHATGARHRLDRGLSGGFGGEAYSREELVAEMCSAFLCARCGIDGPVIRNQAAYVAGWVRALEGDPRMVVRAAGQAQRAARLILGEPGAAEGSQPIVSND